MMPGNRLSKTENKLLKRWKNKDNLPPNTLKSISIKGDQGLRGIKSLDIEFRYPLSVVCGRNGSGKTTVLSLAALGFHTIKGHFPRGARLSNNRRRESAYLTFVDFFYKGPGDPDITGVNIQWEYTKRDSVSITKRSEKWMHYDRRPKRAVHYLGVVRAIPAIEQSVLKSHFNAKRRLSNPIPLNDKYLRRLNEIMGREYDFAGVLRSQNHRLRSCRTVSPYSSFNMGAGEDIIIDLLGVLQNTSNNSLIVIEEIELGLHPEALSILAKHLQEIILEKDLQLVVSTHSRDFIDALPRQARILLQAGEESHTVIYSPTTRFAMGSISEKAEPELRIYCEDNFAKEIIKQSLSNDQRKRVEIISIGDKVELSRIALLHLRAQFNSHHLVIWDGDVTDQEVKGWLKGHKNELTSRISYTFLPGCNAPEKMMVDILNSVNGFRAVKDGFRVDNSAEAEQVVHKLAALNDPHNIPYKASECFHIEKYDAIRTLIDCASRTNNTDFNYIKEKVNEALDGKILKGRD